MPLITVSLSGMRVARSFSLLLDPKQPLQFDDALPKAFLAEPPQCTCPSLELVWSAPTSNATPAMLTSAATVSSAHSLTVSTDSPAPAVAVAEPDSPSHAVLYGRKLAARVDQPPTTSRKPAVSRRARRRRKKRLRKRKGSKKDNTPKPKPRTFSATTSPADLMRVAQQSTAALGPGVGSVDAKDSSGDEDGDSLISGPIQVVATGAAEKVVGFALSTDAPRDDVKQAAPVAVPAYKSALTAAMEAAASSSGTGSTTSSLLSETKVDSNSDSDSDSDSDSSLEAYDLREDLSDTRKVGAAR